jgi:gamma-glutamyl:cysteine ligase YbdK (ATP-grasp superfamily)
VIPRHVGDAAIDRRFPGDEPIDPQFDFILAKFAVEKTGLIRRAVRVVALAATAEQRKRAARFGNQAKLVDTDTYRSASVEDTVRRLVDVLRRTAIELDCENYLDHCVTMARNPSSAQRQLDLMTETNDPREVVRRLVEDARITEKPKLQARS